MSVWFCVPSARPPEVANERLSMWRRRGYMVAAFRDEGAEAVDADQILYGQYTGYAAAVNALVKHVLTRDPSAEWLIGGNDDVEPDPAADPSEIARQLTAHFRGTFGVMQPTGDKFGAILSGSSIVHPWMGREWCRRMYGGRGPLCDAYYHFFEDTEHKLIAEKYGALLMRPDLCQFHDHFERVPGTNQMQNVEPPPHLVRAKSQWGTSLQIFKTRKREGFPGHEPL